MIRFEDATDDEFVRLVPTLREADAEEWRMASGKTPKELLQDGYKLPSGENTMNRVALDDEGRPLILFGVNPFLGTAFTGWVWLIASKQAPRHYREFAREWDTEIGALLEVGEYLSLYTASWVGNPTHHRWLEAMGFVHHGQPFKYGPLGAIFQPFIYHP